MRGLSQQRLAEMICVEKSLLSHFEKGRKAPSFLTFQRMAAALCVSADWLIGRSGVSHVVVVDGGLASRIHKLSAGHRDEVADFVEQLEAFAARSRK